MRRLSVRRWRGLRSWGLMLVLPMLLPLEPAGAPAVAAPAAGTAELQTAVPARFQGQWAASPKQCGAGGGESSLTIGSQQIRFYESAGAIKAAVTRGERELALIAELSGEGETWLAFSHFRLSADQKSLADITGEPEYVRHRCP